MNVNSSTLAPDRSEVNVLVLNTKSIKNDMQIPSNGNLNDYYNAGQTGLYYVTSSVLNNPAGYAGMMLVAVGGLAVQLIIGTSGSYLRVRSGSPAAWGNWRQINLT